jgi:RNA polymerase sigma-70 factor (ECF subfamily)
MDRVRLRGIPDVSKTYFTNYGKHDDWRLALGTVEGQLAILVYDPHDDATASDSAPASPTYFMLITWQGQQIAHIRDYRYVRYIMRGITTIPK